LYNIFTEFDSQKISQLIAMHVNQTQNKFL